MTMQTILEAHGVSVHFGGVKALDGVDFVVRRGELRCLIGPNGAGKTTFFRCLTGAQRPTLGTVTFKGEDIIGLERYEIARAGIGIKTQIPSLFDGLSVQENLWLSLRRLDAERERRERTEAVLERLGIASLRHEILGRMAHGQRQLVELGMVVASDPDLVLLDEPAAGMTGREVDRLAEVIRDLNRNHTVVVVEHDMQFIRSIADRVTVFHRGRVLAEGHVDTILSDAMVRDVYLGKSHAA